MFFLVRSLLLGQIFSVFFSYLLSPSSPSYLLLFSSLAFLMPGFISPRKGFIHAEELRMCSGDGTCFPPVPMGRSFCWKGWSQEAILSQGLTHILHTFQEAYHWIPPPPILAAPPCFKFIIISVCFPKLLCWFRNIKNKVYFFLIRKEIWKPGQFMFPQSR